MQSVSRDMKILEEGEKEMRAMDVFSNGILYLKKEVLNDITNRYGSTDLADIYFIITIPAIWSEPAKQFIQEAAIEVVTLECFYSPNLISIDPVN